MKFIQTQATGIRSTFGKYTATLSPGLNLYIPGIQRIDTVCNKIRQDEFIFEAKTVDDVFVTIALKVQHQVLEENSVRAFYKLNRPYEQLDAYIENVVRAEVPQMTLNEMFTQQDAVCKTVHRLLSDKMNDFGFTIVNTLITRIEPDRRVKDAMNSVYESERLKVSAKNKADAHYISEVRQAEADKERKRLQGEGISEQRIAIMKGYQSGVSELSKTLDITPRDIIDFVTKTQHLDTMESIGRSQNAKTIFLNNEVDSYMKATTIKD